MTKAGKLTVKYPSSINRGYRSGLHLPSNFKPDYPYPSSINRGYRSGNAYSQIDETVGGIHPLSIEAIVLAVTRRLVLGLIEVSILYQSRLSFWRRIPRLHGYHYRRYPSSINRGYRSGMAAGAATPASSKYPSSINRGYRSGPTTWYVKEDDDTYPSSINRGYRSGPTPIWRSAFHRNSIHPLSIEAIVLAAS